MFVTDKLQLMDINITETSKDNLNLTARRREDIVGGHKDHKSKKKKNIMNNSLTSDWIPLLKHFAVSY